MGEYFPFAPLGLFLSIDSCKVFKFSKRAFSVKLAFPKRTCTIPALSESIDKNKPSGAKGKYWKSFYITSTMGPSIQLDINALQDFQTES